MGSNIFKFCFCRHDRNQFVKAWEQKKSEICRMFLLLVHVGMHASYPFCLYSSHNIELWRKSSRCPEMAKRKVFICFLIAETVLLVCRTFKISPHTNNLVNQGRKLHLNLVCLTKKANTSKGSRKRRANVFCMQKKSYGTYMFLLDFFCFCAIVACDELAIVVEMWTASRFLLLWYLCTSQ